MMLGGAATMILSPVPGSPADTSGECGIRLPTPESSDFYAHAKHRLGTLTMQDEPGLMMSPGATRPSKRNRVELCVARSPPHTLCALLQLGTPRALSSTPASCTSTVIDEDDDEDCKNVQQLDLSSRQLFDDGPVGWALRQPSTVKMPMQPREHPPPTNVNPFAPPAELNRCNSVEPAVSSRAKRPPAAPEKRGVGDADLSSGESRFEHDFEVLKAIGSGSFGTVHKVKSRLDGLLYAVKSTRARSKGKAHRERMLAEVFALATLSAEHSRLDHEGARHVVRYYQAWIEDERLYIQTELCDASLEKFLRQRGSLDPHAVFAFLRQLLLALDLLHSRDLVHLDIKPANIFINLAPNRPVTYKLGDFGLVARANAEGDVVEGDSRYMSKELLDNDLFDAPHPARDLTKCDIFSLGATAYEICRGTPLPPNGDEWHMLRDRKPPALPGIPPQLLECIALMMQPTPAQRPAAAILLAEHPQLQSQVQQLAKQLERERHLGVANFRDQVRSLAQHTNQRLSRSHTWA